MVVAKLLVVGAILSVLSVTSSIALPADTYLLELTWLNASWSVVEMVLWVRLEATLVLAARMINTAVSLGVSTLVFPVTLFMVQLAWAIMSAPGMELAATTVMVVLGFLLILSVVIVVLILGRSWLTGSCLLTRLAEYMMTLLVLAL